MQVNLTHHSSTRKSLELVVPIPEVSAEFSKVVAKIAPKVRIPGFRPGKAPKDVLMGRYQREIYSEVVENLVKRYFWSAAAEAGTQPISQPAVEKVDLQEGNEGHLHLHYDVAPEVLLPDYKGIQLTKKKRIIDEAAILEHLDGLRQQAAKFTPVEDAAAEGHIATFDVKVKPQGMKAQEFKDQVVQLAAERPFDKELIGMKVDDTKTFTITIPSEDPNKAMAGKGVVYEARMKDLRTREIPELNDDFAKDLGDYADLAALKGFVKGDLEEAAERDAQSRLQTSLLDTLLDAANFEVPASMVALQLDDYCNEFAHQISRQGVDPRKVNWSAYRQSRMNEAERAVRSGYLLQAIGNTEDIQVTEEEIDGEIRRLMEEHGVQQAFEPFKADLEKRGATTEIKGRVRTEKIFEKLLAGATVKEELLEKDAFQALMELERKRETGAPVARFDAGGMEGGDLEDQEGGDPDAVKAAEAPEAEPIETVEAKPKKAPKKTEEAEKKPKKEEGTEKKPKKAAKE
ncbi:MAG: trigger factor [Holophaga sp.]|nr:trigger factor [Holophaga sp.]